MRRRSLRLVLSASVPTAIYLAMRIIAYPDWPPPGDDLWFLLALLFMAPGYLILVPFMLLVGLGGAHEYWFWGQGAASWGFWAVSLYLGLSLYYQIRGDNNSATVAVDLSGANRERLQETSTEAGVFLGKLTRYALFGDSRSQSERDQGEMPHERAGLQVEIKRAKLPRRGRLLAGLAAGTIGVFVFWFGLLNLRPIVLCTRWDTMPVRIYELAPVETVVRCLRWGADPNRRDELGSTPLHEAAGNDDALATVAALIDAGADPNARDVEGFTPLHFTAWFHPDTAVIAALIDAGADPVARNDYGSTPLNYVGFRSTDAAVIALFIDAGADPNVRNQTGVMPLHSAKNPAVIAALIDAGADPNARTQQGHTPLHRASHIGTRDVDPALVVALLEGGADPNARVEPDAANRTAPFDRANEEFGYPGETPLHRAARVIETPAVMTALIEGGADPNARDDSGSTPLHLAVAHTENPAVVTALIVGGADPNARDDSGSTPLRLAEDNGNPAMLAAFIDARP